MLHENFSVGTKEHAIDLLERGKLVEAEALLATLRKSDPQDVGVKRLSWSCAFKAQDYDEAEARIEAILKEHPQDYKSYYCRALVKKRRGNIPGTIENCHRALHIKPDFDKAREMLETLGAPLPDETPAIQAFQTPPHLNSNLDHVRGRGDARSIRVTSQALNTQQNGDTRLSVKPDRQVTPFIDWGITEKHLTIRDVIEDSEQRQRVPVQGDLLHACHRRISSYPKHILLGTSMLVGAYFLLTSSTALTAAYAVVSILRLPLHPENLLLVSLALCFFGGLGVLGGTIAMARCYRVEIFKRQIWLSEGVLSKKAQPIWLWEIQNASLKSAPSLFLTNNAEILLVTEKRNERDQKITTISLRGIYPYGVMAKFFRELVTAALIERRFMKNVWI